MPQSVPSPSVVQATWAATLFDEWILRGLTDVVICPGSRSTPMALACAQRDELTLHVRIDERSAGFFALGRALALRRPVAIIVTSGTAAAELHACVAEATQAFVPLLVLTADRPPELHGVGAPQTMDQGHLFGAMVRRFEDPGVPQLGDAPTWRDLAVRLWTSARDAAEGAGPVHLNASFVEPLVAEPLALVPASRSDVVAPLTADAVVDLAGQRVLCVVGRGVSGEVIDGLSELGWVVLGDATAQGSTPYFDALLRVDAFVRRVRPDVVVRIGGLPASKVLGERLREWGSRTVGFAGGGFLADPSHSITERYEGLPGAGTSAPADRSYAAQWRDAAGEVGTWLASLDEQEALTEPLVARTVVAASATSGVALVVGSSMPVRDVEWWTPARRAATFSNRGVNGIDGVVSTILGVGAGARSIGLVGDVTMLHDVSGLVDGVGAAGGSVVVVVADNGGGGIFSFLAQAALDDHALFERLFATPRDHDLVEVARAFGHRSLRVDSRTRLVDALDEALTAPGVTVVVAQVPTREENVRIHAQLNDGVRRLLEST